MAGFPSHSQGSDSDFDGYINKDNVLKEGSSPQLRRVLVSQLVEKDRLASPSAKVVDIVKPRSLLKLHSFTFTINLY